MNTNIWNKDCAKNNAKMFNNGDVVTIIDYEFTNNSNNIDYVSVFDKDRKRYKLVVDFEKKYVISITKVMPVIYENNEIFYPISLQGDTHSKKYYINSKYLMPVINKNSSLIEFARGLNYNPKTSWKTFQLPKDKFYFKNEQGVYPNKFVEDEINKLKADLKAEREKVESLKKSLLDISTKLMACVNKMIDLADEK